MRTPKKPAIQFYVGDWMKAADVRACSLAARGLWMDMICLMHESTPAGSLRHSTGKVVTNEQLARQVGSTVTEVEQLLRELGDAGVYSRDQDGAIYCRRLVRDEQKRALCSEAGRRGGNPTLKGETKGRAKGDPKGGPNGGDNPTLGPPLGHPGDTPARDAASEAERQLSTPDDPNDRHTPNRTLKGASKPNPTPSSSSSSSSSDYPPTPQGGVAWGGSAKGKTRKRSTLDDDPRFVRFWNAYPRHEARGTACRAFAKLDPPPDLLEVILRAVEAQKRCGCLEPRTTTDGRSTIPHPASWLNGQRWKDEITPTVVAEPASEMTPDKLENFL